MSPSAESANPPAQMECVASEKLLDEGELILLAIKPSGWFVLLVSWPVLVVAASLAGGTFLASVAMGVNLPEEMIYFFCMVMVVGRMVFACAQWVGRLYLLTSRRVMTIHGVVAVRIDHYPLKRIGETILSATAGERLFSLGSLMFQAVDTKQPATAWIHIFQPEEIRRKVDIAIRQAR